MQAGLPIGYYRDYVPKSLLLRLFFNPRYSHWLPVQGIHSPALIYELSDRESVRTYTTAIIQNYLPFSIKKNTFAAVAQVNELSP